MQVKQEILQWLLKLNIDQIKYIVTIKNQKSQFIIKQIIQTPINCTPIVRSQHGYAINKIKQQQSIYCRQKVRFKNDRKKQKQQKAKIMLENLTVSRNNNFQFSVTKQFIKNGHLEEIMLLLSDNKLFQGFTLMQVCYKIDRNQEYSSAWFIPGNIHPITEWIIYFFQIQIYQAFQSHKKKKNEPLQNNYFYYCQKYINKDKIQRQLIDILDKKIKNKSTKKNNQQTKEQNQEQFIVYVQEKDYLLSRAMQRFDQQNRDIGQIIFQYRWYTHDPKNKLSFLLRQLSKQISQDFQIYKLQLKTLQIQQYQNEKAKKKRLKKKKKNIEKKQAKKQEQAEEQNQIDSTPEQKQIQKQQINRFQLQLLKHAQQNSSQFQLSKFQNNQQQKIKKLKKKNNKKTSQCVSSLSQETSLLSKQLAQLKLIDHEKKEQQQLKKIKQTVNNRINEYIQSFTQNLQQQSQNMNKYRTGCIQMIKEAIQQLNISSKWQLKVFGSYSIDFALKQSDLDILIHFQNQQYSFSQIFQHLRYKEWLRQCNITQIQSAKVSIIQFQILLSKLKNGKYKINKTINEVIHVDLSVSSKQTLHQGVENSQKMRKIFQQNYQLKYICFIFKQLFRLYNLNKPFTGGIGSYALTIMLYNIVINKQIDLSKGNLFQTLHVVCDYFGQQFQPFKSIISSKPTKLLPNPKFQLNIQDPFTQTLLNTNKIRKIEQVLILIKKFSELLRTLKEEMTLININQNRKMKKIFFNMWNSLFITQN